MFKEINKKLNEALKNIVDDNTIFNDNLSEQEILNIILSKLNIIDFYKYLDTFNNKDKEKILSNISSIKKFIKLCRAYNKEIKYAIDNIDEYVDKYTDNIASNEEYYDVFSFSNEKICRELKCEDIEDYIESIKNRHINLLNGNSYFDELMDKFGTSISEKIYLVFNNDTMFRTILNNLDTTTIFERNISGLFSNKNYKILDNVSFETAMVAYNKGMYTLFQWFKDDYLNQLSNEQLIPIAHTLFDYSEKEYLKSKIDIITSKIKLKDLVNEETHSYEIDKIYKHYKYVDEESLNYLLDMDKYISYQLNDSVMHNKEYIKKIFTQFEYQIMFFVPNDVFDDELFDFMLDKLDGDIGKISFWNFGIEWRKGPLLRNPYALKKIALNIYSNQETFLNSIPDEYMKKEYVLFCRLNGMDEPVDERIKRYYDRSIESIKEAIDDGYKCNDSTYLINNEEIRAFIEKGQPEIIDYWQEFDNIIDYDTFIYAFEHGYKANENTQFHLLKEQIMNLYDYCLDNNHTDIVKALYQVEEDIFKSIIRIKVGDSTYEEYFDKIGVLDEILKYNIFVKHERHFLDEDWLYLIKRKYSDYKTIWHFLDFIGPYDDEITEKNYLEYFNDNGPTKKFYEMYLFDDSLDFERLLRNDAYKNVYADEPWVISYLEFKSEKLYLNYQFMKDKLDIYFDSKGPTKALYDYALFDNTWFDLMHKGQYQKAIVELKEMYKDNPEVVSYIRFRRVVVSFDYSKIQNIDDISRFFDDEWANKELLDGELLSDNGFAYVFCEECPIHKRYANELGIKNYIEFKKEHLYLNYKFITDKNDILKYFDDDGPTKALCDYALFTKFWFDDICRDTDSFTKYYKDTPYIIGYIEFRTNNLELDYSFLAGDFKLLKNYFDANGPTDELYNLSLMLPDLSLFNVLKNNYFLEEKFKSNKAISTYIGYIIKYNINFSRYFPISFELKDIENYFDEDGYTEQLQRFFLEYDGTEKLLSSLAHNDAVLNNLNNDFVNMFRYYLIDKYFKGKKTNPEELYDYLLNYIGPNLLFSIENPNILKLLNYDIENLDKIFNLFYRDNPVLSYEDTYNNFIVSILNSKFKRDYTYVREIFTNINSQISSLTIDELNKYLFFKKISPKCEKLNNYYEEIIYVLGLNEDEIEQFKQAIIECKNLNETPLRRICRKYLEKTQRDYLELHRDTILIEFGITPVYSKEDALLKLSEYIYNKNNSYEEFVKYRNILRYSVNDYDSKKGFIDELKMTKEEYDTILNITLEQYNLIIYSITNKTKPDDTIKKEFSLYKRFINQFIKYGINTDYFTSHLYQELNVKRVSVMKFEDIDMIKVLSELDVDIYLHSIENNPKLYNQLKKVCTNYGLGRLPKSMSSALQNSYDIKLPGGINNIGLFITRFEQIIKNKQRILSMQGGNIELQNSVLTFMETVGLISNVNSETYELKRLIGSSEYFDFISNKWPNDAPYDRLKREDKLEKIVDYLYSVSNVTIPSHDIVLDNEEIGKSINFIIGNRTNPANICHGERTGACMRVGGVGEGLFLKCLTDKNWFHIRIEDSNTHEYISRVSGFRNGNTVYLNQLRDVPKNSSYTNKDLQVFIKMYANMLIEETKDTEYPVENVFINVGYAMESYKDTEYHLGYKIQQEYNMDDIQDLILRDSNNIWTDVKNDAYLLATSKEGKITSEGYVPLKNGPDNTIIYPAQRDKIYGIDYMECNIPKHCFIESNSDLVIEKINRVHAMKEKLLGSDYKYEIDDEITDYNVFKDGYASSDWYAYIDVNNNLYCDYISRIGDSPYCQLEKAIKEMNFFKDILINKYNLNKEVSYAKKY